jgi:F0F1-type ATP synthase delta subunit
MEKAYAQALVNVLKEGVTEDAATASLMKHLKEVGRMKLLPAILRELRTLDARAATLGATVEVATEAEAPDALLAASEAGITARTASVNPRLIRGWRAREGSRLIDRSGKRALIDIYRRITS